MRLKIVLSALLFCAQWAVADEYTTAGDGRTYSFETLSQIAGAGVEKNADGYQVVNSITIAEGDTWRMDDGATVGLAANVQLTIEGEADFRQTNLTVFKPATEQDGTGLSICIKSKGTTEFENCEFRSVGVELMGEGAVNVRHCSFLHHDGSSAAALYFITAGAAGVVEDCHFEGCRKAAIGSAANASQPLTIKDCVLVKNSTANGNVPQINITAAKGLQITGCTVTGNPANNMVGGIGISNFMSFDAEVLISGCTITDNRYGIGIVGPVAKLTVKDNTLRDNKYETNPMNGGSGISLYDPYGQTSAMISGNHIEGSLWGVTVIGCKDVNLGRTDVPEGDECYNPGGNVFKDNGNGGQLYDLYNNSTLTVYAQGNTWNVSQQTQEQIETVVFHKADDAKLGEVIYWPAATETGIAEIETMRNVENEIFYDLGGRQWSNSKWSNSQMRKWPNGPMPKGLYIVNGRKVAL